MPSRQRIRTEALIVGYALARMGRPLLKAMGWRTWDEAFQLSAAMLGEKQSSIRLLRDEFDVFFPNGRAGWLQRDPRPSRLAVLREFEAVSDEALIETVRQALSGQHDDLAEIVQLVETPPSGVANVAERLLTGKLAEEFFVGHSREILEVPRADLVDRRHEACGFDFSLLPCPKVAVEVKGLRGSTGDVLFTDREWTEALRRGADYWVVLVGRLREPPPVARVIRNTAAVWRPKAGLVSTTTAVWRVHAGIT